MEQSHTISELATALCLAQAEMGGAVKDSANPFFKSKYADLTSVVKAIKEPFANHGLSYVQMPFADASGIGVTTRLMHSSGEWLESSYTLPMVKQDPQAAGSAITYARRYALQAMAGIPTADDDSESAMLRNVPAFTPEQREQMLGLLASGDAFGFRHFVDTVGQETMDALFNSAPAGQKTRWKDDCRVLYTQARDSVKSSVASIQALLADNDIGTIDQGFSEMSELQRQYVMAALSDIEKHQIQQMRAGQ